MNASKSRSSEGLMLLNNNQVILFFLIIKIVGTAYCDCIGIDKKLCINWLITAILTQKNQKFIFNQQMYEFFVTYTRIYTQIGIKLN